MTDLVIVDPEARRLASDLMDLTGERLDTILTAALQAELERTLARKARQERIMTITREIAASSRYGVAA
jgi:hypothetical protein